MKRTILALGIASLAAGTVAAGPQAAQRAATDHEVVLAVDESTTFSGGLPQGINHTPTTESEGVGDRACTKNPDTYCETIWIELSNPYEEENARKGRERANLLIELTTADQTVSDFDLYVYESDADGAKGAEVANAGNFPLLANTSAETVTIPVTTTADDEVKYFYVEVMYFAAVSAPDFAISFA